MIFSEIAYYKPVQCGKPSDIDWIQSQQPELATYNSYDLAFPASPDYSSSLENIEISLNKIKADFEQIKNKYQFIVVEGAGGLAVPLNSQDLVSDIARVLALPIVLVIRPDLGTINHSLLSIEHARARDLEILGLMIAQSRQPDLSAAVIEQNKNAIKSIMSIAGVEHYEPSIHHHQFSKQARA